MYQNTSYLPCVHGSIHGNNSEPRILIYIDDKMAMVLPLDIEITLIIT